MHVLSGTTEIISWCLAWWWGVDDKMEYRDIFTQVQVVASMVHIATAAYQTPIVFGTQAVMVPAYTGCVLIKFWCALDLWFNMTCARKSVRLYNVLSIYTWCRVFIGLFGRTVMFQDSLYSVSILFAGAICLPSVGPGAFGGAFLFIAAYQLVVHYCASDHFRANQFREHGRDLFSNGAFNEMLSTMNNCPFAEVEGMDPRQKMRSVFDSIDVDRNGVIDKKELMLFAERGHSMSWIEALQAHRDFVGNETLNFEEFCAVLGPRMSVLSTVSKVSLKQAIASDASYDAKARFLFDAMNSCAAHETEVNATPDHIDLHDLAYVLVQYGVPAGEAKSAMRK
eukprot:COSAG02_NODE_88_length_38629_cov_457.967999_16_plen_339_part_00